MRALGSPAQMQGVLRAALAAGINHLETAPAYGPAERFLGQALQALAGEGLEPQGGWLITSKLLPGCDLASGQEQLRAILRASAFGKVRVLLPMVAHLTEIRSGLQALDRARQQLDRRGQAYGVVEVGAMIEVPAAAIGIDLFLRHFDFVSIGTNDLIQYTLAIDRADESVAHLYDSWHPSVLTLIANTIRRACDYGRHVSICGEMAGDPAFTEVLLAMGLRSFSMHPAQISRWM
jgi:phosphoenolpyruvate synthase/pyruvate phosphate dikinase